MLDSIGMWWILQAIAFENAVICIPMALYARKSRTVGAAAGSVVSAKVLRKSAFILQVAAALIQPSYRELRPNGITLEFPTLLRYRVGFGALLLAINDGISAVSRILMSVHAYRLVRLNLFLFIIGSAISVFGLWLVAPAQVDETAQATLSRFFRLEWHLRRRLQLSFPGNPPRSLPTLGVCLG